MHMKNKATSSFMDILTIDNGIDDTFTITSRHLSEGVYSNPSAHYGISVADNKNDNDLLTIPRQADIGIFLTTSVFRTVMYKKDTR